MHDRRITVKALIIGLYVSVGAGVLITRTASTKAANDEILTALANYKSWGRITKAPFQVLSIETLKPPMSERPNVSEMPAEGLRIDGIGG